MSKKIFNEVKGLEDAEDGGFNAGKLWQLKKKLYPKVNEPPTAMVTTEGELITSEKDIKDEAVKHFKNVYRHRQIKPGLEQIKKDREKLCTS